MALTIFMTKPLTYTMTIIQPLSGPSGPISHLFSTIKRCFQRLQRRYYFAEPRIQHLFSPILSPLSATLAAILVIVILGVPQLHYPLEESLVYVVSWILCFALIPSLVRLVILPLVSMVVAVYLLCFAKHAQPMRQPPRLPYYRPARKYGRPRRGLSPYAISSLGCMRTESWGPPFRMSLTTLTEEPFGPLLPGGSRTGCVKRVSQRILLPLYPTHLRRPVVAPRKSVKRKADFEDGPRVKRARLSGEFTAVFVPNAPSIPTKPVVPSPLIDDGDDVDEGGDAYFDLSLVSLLLTDSSSDRSSESRGDDEDDMSLEYSYCSDDTDPVERNDAELIGLGIDLDESSGPCPFVTSISSVGSNETVKLSIVDSSLCGAVGMTSLAGLVVVYQHGCHFLNAVHRGDVTLTASEVAELDDDADVLTASEVAELDDDAVSHVSRLGSVWIHDSLYLVPVRRSARRKSVLTKSEAAELDDDQESKPRVEAPLCRSKG